MKNLIITYDLRKQGQDYQSLIKAIESFKNYAKISQSVWFIKTNSSLEQVYDVLLKYIDSNDTLFIAEMSSAAWCGVEKASSDYMKKYWNA